MTQQAFDQKNQQDYDDITQRLNSALDEINKNSKLPATLIQVAKLAEVSRNTVSNREFPAERLKAIKERRKEDEKQNKKRKRNEEEQLKEERNTIAKEAVYWFSEYLAAQKDKDSFERQLQRALENAEFYKQEFKKQQEEIRTLEAKNEQLKDLLRDLK